MTEIEALRQHVADLEQQALAAALEARRNPGTFGKAIATAMDGQAMRERNWRLADALAEARRQLRLMEATN